MKLTVIKVSEIPSNVEQQLTKACCIKDCINSHTCGHQQHTDGRAVSIDFCSKLCQIL